MCDTDKFVAKSVLEILEKFKTAHQVKQTSPVLLNCTVCELRDGKPHYGSPSVCNGCRAFFRRSVRLKLTYKCSFGNNCDIAKLDGRQSCKKCRMQKCLKTGLRPEAVHPSRDTIIHSEKRKNKESSKVNHSSNSSSPDSTVTECDSTLRHDHGTVTTAGHSSKLSNTNSQQTCVSVKLHLQRTIMLRATTSTVPTIEEHRILLQQAFNFANQITESFDKLLLRQGRPALLVSNARPRYFLGSVVNLQAQAILHVAKQLSTFIALPLCDQVALLRAFAASAVLFDDVMRSKGLHGHLLLADGINFVQRDPICPLVCNVLDQLQPAIECEDVNAVECALIKSILFWNPDVCQRESKAIVHDTQSLYISALEHYNLKKYASHGRFGMLLLLPGKLECLSLCFRRRARFWYKEKDPLVSEIFATDP